jgi:hypothetical protein
MTKEDISEVIRLYAIHKSIIHRCTSENNKAYKDYGGRGIYVCDEWLDSPTFIQWCLENDAKKGLDLDRIDNDGPYAPWNCRFVTRKENRANRRPAKIPKDAVLLSAFGETKTLSEWVEDPRCPVKNTNTLYNRAVRKSWSHEEAVTLPIFARPAR